MQKLTDKDWLKLHVAPDGFVWFADGDRPPISSGLTVHEFADTASRKRYRRVRILGSQGNAALVSAMYAQCLAYDGRLELATPRVCANLAEQQQPELALLRARGCRLPVSLGGWHLANDADRTAYELVERLSREPNFDGPTSALLNRHPAWPAMEFIAGMQQRWLAWVLAFVIDPRWHIDPRHPGRSAKLRCYLGLTPKIMQRLVTHVDETGPSARCYAATAVWKSDPPDRETCREKPGCFLWRCRGSLDPDDWRGDLRATSRCVTFLQHTWLHALQSFYARGPRVQLFSPAAFFKSDEETAAYVEHAKAHQATLLGQV